MNAGMERCYFSGVEIFYKFFLCYFTYAVLTDLDGQLLQIQIYCKSIRNTVIRLRSETIFIVGLCHEKNIEKYLTNLKIRKRCMCFANYLYGRPSLTKSYKI
jgi:hypothetical protein